MLRQIRLEIHCFCHQAAVEQKEANVLTMTPDHGDHTPQSIISINNVSRRL